MAMNAYKKTLIEAPTTQHARKVAVVLNGNARSVNEHLISDLRGLLQDETLYVSHSLDQSRFIARHIVNKGFDTVLCGGGDGTFTQVISDILALRPVKAPVFGLLRLGTGNAMAEVLGSKAGLKGIASDLRQVRETNNRKAINLLSSEGRLTPFAGVGLDAMILEDYKKTRDGVLGKVFGKKIEGPVGYALAIGGRSTWRMVRNERPVVTIRNEGAPAYQMDHLGRRIGEAIPRGEVLYHGEVTLAAASTIPYYGFRCKLFPQVESLSDRFQFRITRARPMEVIPKLNQLFSGELRPSTLWDYACTAVSIEAEDDTAYQIGGDLVGNRRKMHIGIRSVEAVLGSEAEPQPSVKESVLRSIA